MKRLFKPMAILLALVIFLTACTAGASTGESSTQGSQETTQSSENAQSSGEKVGELTSDEANQSESSVEPEGSTTSEGAESGEQGTETAEAAEVPTEGVFYFPTGDVAPYSELEEGEEADAEEVSRIERVMRDYSPVDTILVNKATSFYYYNQLDSTKQMIYDTMLMACQDPSGENYVIYVSSVDPKSSQFKDDVSIAFWAMCYDHPELYWIYASRTIWYKYSTSNTNANMVYFYVDEYKDFEKDVTAFNAAVDDFLKDIDTKKSETEIAKQIHDKLISMVTYDYALCYERNLTYDDLGHTAFGALVHNQTGQANYAVCDGYTMAFTYLCQQVGIEAIYIGGAAGADLNDLGGHAWSMAKLDGKWYEIDSTWDDFGNKLANPNIASSEWISYYKEMYANSYYMEEMQHYLFMVSTATMSNYSANAYYDYYTLDGRYVFHMGNASYHRRDNEYDSFYPWSYLMDLAPIAN